MQNDSLLNRGECSGFCGHEAITRERFSCPYCQSLRAQPVNPKMADLHPSQLRLHKPTFFSIGTGCFGQLQVKIDHRHEKLWGLLFKYLTRAVHIELLFNINTDSFLITLRRFISQSGKPAELLCDQGTHFRGGSII